MSPLNSGVELPLQSCIYTGVVWHKRRQPKVHQFSYRVFMMYLSLDELDILFGGSRFWGKRWYHIARFRRGDFYGDTDRCIIDCVKERVKKDLGFTPTGSIRLLANLRYFGYVTNPISCYYCYDESDNLVAQLLEVTNTPWGEKHTYVLDFRDQAHSDHVEIGFRKKMHVSPFMPMDMRYQWKGLKPGEQLKFSLSSWTNTQVAVDSGLDRHQHHSKDNLKSKNRPSPIFKAGANFSRVEINTSSLNKILLSYPLMTLKVVVSIYWQALRLFIKRVNIFQHPSKSRVAPNVIEQNAQESIDQNIESSIERDLKVGQSKN